MNTGLTHVLDTKSNIYNAVSDTNALPLILFGAGFRFSTIEAQLVHRGIRYIVTDNDTKKHGTVLANNTVIISPSEAQSKYPGAWVCITVAVESAYESICKQIMQMGFSHEKQVDFRELVFWTEGVTLTDIVEAEHLFRDAESKAIFDAYHRAGCMERSEALAGLARNNHKQYFDPDIIKVSDNEAFIDVGGYTGDTVETFVEYSGGCFKVIHSFEPSPVNKAQYDNAYLRDPRINIHPLGLGSERATVGFIENASSSIISEIGQTTIQIDRLDNILNGECATFIKMDIEGAELDALIGAEQTIRRHKPKLAICVYHRDMDIINITRLLRDYVPNYAFYLRHYSASSSETVLYAVAG